MKKVYIKPEIEVVSLITQEKITTDEESYMLDGSTGVEKITDDVNWN